MNYKVIQISTQPPRSWSFKGNDGKVVQMESYKVKFEGVNEAVEINRKPGNKPSVGEVLSGTITDSQYGQRFKADKKAQAGGGRGNYVDHHEDIKIEWAIGQAIQLGMATNALKIDDIEFIATQLLGVADRIKNPKPLDTVVEDDGQNITLEDIPF